MSDSPRANLQVFFGEATENVCRIYAVAENPEHSSAKINGTLHGPLCQYGRTLPTDFPLRDMAKYGQAMAEAIIPEPCFWTPEMPQLYRYDVHIETSHGTTEAKGMLGIRRFGAAKQNLYFDRERWVLRAGRAARLRESDLPAWHDARMTAVIELPTDQLCEAASQIGVLLVAVLPKACADAAAQVCRLGRWPAVGIIVLDAVPDEIDLRSLARNVLFAQVVDTNLSRKPAAWAQLIFCNITEAAAFMEFAKDCQLPVVAQSSVESIWKNPAEARTACDRLQRELASTNLDVAGYCV
jgi:hypothetical protein